MNFKAIQPRSIQRDEFLIPGNKRLKDRRVFEGRHGFEYNINRFFCQGFFLNACVSFGLRFKKKTRGTVIFDAIKKGRRNRVSG